MTEPILRSRALAGDYLPGNRRCPAPTGRLGGRGGRGAAPGRKSYNNGNPAMHAIVQALMQAIMQANQPIRRQTVESHAHQDRSQGRSGL